MMNSDGQRAQNQLKLLCRCHAECVEGQPSEGGQQSEQRPPHPIDAVVLWHHVQVQVLQVREDGVVCRARLPQEAKPELQRSECVEPLPR